MNAFSSHRVPQTKKCINSVLHNRTNASKALGPHGQETQLMEAAEDPDPGNGGLCPEWMEWDRDLGGLSIKLLHLTNCMRWLKCG